MATANIFAARAKCQSFSRPSFEAADRHECQLQAIVHIRFGEKLIAFVSPVLFFWWLPFFSTSLLTVSALSAGKDRQADEGSDRVEMRTCARPARDWSPGPAVLPPLSLSPQVPYRLSSYTFCFGVCRHGAIAAVDDTSCDKYFVETIIGTRCHRCHRVGQRSGRTPAPESSSTRSRTRHARIRRTERPHDESGHSTLSQHRVIAWCTSTG